MSTSPYTPDFMQYVVPFNGQAQSPDVGYWSSDTPTPADAARQRKNQKTDQKRKQGTQARQMIAQQNVPTQTAQQPQRPTMPQGFPSAAALPQTALPTSSVPLPPQVQDQAPEAQYHQPAKGLEYLGLGLSLLFPGSPISYAASGMLSGLSRRSQNDYERQRQEIQDKQAESEKQTQQEQIERNRNFEQSLKLPSNWTKMTPEDQYNYLSVRYTAALQNGDYDAANATLSQMNSLPRAGNEFASTRYTLEGRLPLAEAQAARIKELHQEFLDKMAHADAQTKMRMQSARMYAMSRASGAAQNEREMIADMAAINAMTMKDQGAFQSHAFELAKDQYHAELATWQKQEQAYQLGIGSDPGAAPAPPNVNVTVQGAGGTQPIYVIENGQLKPYAPGSPPHGGGSAEAPRTPPTRVTGGSSGQLPAAASVVKLGKQRGMTDAEIREKMHANGYSDAEINGALFDADIGGT